jgi:hypothetical protein
VHAEGSERGTERRERAFARKYSLATKRSEYEVPTKEIPKRGWEAGYVQVR